MAGIYKLVFDLSFFCSLTGFYLNIFTDAAPSAPGFVLLCTGVMLTAYLRQKLPGKLPMAALLLPLLAVIFGAGIWSSVQLLALLGYAAYSLWTERIQTTYDDFYHQFRFALGLLLSFVPAFLYSANAARAFVAVTPYLILMLAVGVCLLRLLREETPSGGKQGLYILAFVIGCGLLTAGRAPQMLMAAVGFVYEHVIVVVLMGAMLLAGLAFYGLFAFITWLASLLGAEGQVIELDLRSVAEQFGVESTVVDQTGDIAWLRILGYILLALVITGVAVLILRRLLGDRAGKKAVSPWTEERSRIGSGTQGTRRSLLRPRDARQAVRYYYARYLQEAARRGLRVSPGTTAEEMAQKARMYFPEADPADLTAIYVPARYWETQQVTQADADRAQAAWRRLKKTKPPVT